MTIWLLIPIAIIALSFALKPLRAWLERLAEDAESQGKWVDAYYASTTRFLRLSDAAKHAELREMIRWMGNEMLRGPGLVTGMLFMRMRKTRHKTSQSPRQQDDPFSELSEEATHAFGQAMASALLVSSYQSFFFGGRYRSMLQLVMKPKEKEITVSEQIVVRYRDAQKGLKGRNNLNGHSGLTAA